MFDQKTIASVFDGFIYQIGKENLTFRKIKPVDMDLLGDLFSLISRISSTIDQDPVSKALRVRRCATVLVGVIYLSLEKPKKIVPRPTYDHDGTYSTQKLMDFSHGCVGYFTSIMEAEGIDAYEGIGIMMEIMIEKFSTVLSSEDK